MHTFLAQADLETSTQLLTWELTSPVLKMSHSLSIIQWHPYPQGLPGICRIIISKTTPRCFPTVICRNVTSLKTFVRQTQERARSQHIRQVRNSCSGAAANRKHQERSSSAEELPYSLCQAKNHPQVFCYYLQTRVAGPRTGVNASTCTMNC